MRRLFFTLLFAIAGTALRAQIFRTNFLDTADRTTAQILRIWKGYLFATPGSPAARRYWDSTEAAQYPDYDFAATNDCLRAFGFNDFLVLSIRLRDTGLYEITTLLEHDSSDVAIATVRTIARCLPDSSFRLGNYLLWAAAFTIRTSLRTS